MPTPTVRSVSAELAAFRDEVRAALGARDVPVWASMPTPDTGTMTPDVGWATWYQAGTIIDLAPAPAGRRKRLRDPQRLGLGQRRAKDALDLPAAGIAEACRRARVGGRGYGGALVAAGRPVAIDFEGLYTPGNVPTLRRYVDAFRDGCPGQAVGFASIDWAAGVGIPSLARGLTASETKVFRRLLDDLRPLAAGSDFVAVSTMLGEPESADAYCAAFEAIVDGLRDAYALPVQCWLWPGYLYRPQPLAPADAAKIFGLARRIGDAVVIHSGDADGYPDWTRAVGAYGDDLRRVARA